MAAETAPEPKTKINPFMLVLFAVGGLLALWWGVTSLMTNTRSWPSVEAVYTSCNETRDSESGMNEYSITSEYVVDGVTYTNTVYDRPSSVTVGDKITLYYDPADPNLTVSTHSDKLIDGLVGVGIALFCFYSIGKQFTKPKNTPQEQAL